MKPLKIHFTEKESDITIISDSKKAILKAKEAFYYHRSILEKYILKNEQFLKSFNPVKAKSDDKIIKLMTKAAYKCNVGPMAAVAGALADLMLDAMKTKETSNFIPARIALVENGGEIAIESEKSMNVALYAGENELNLNIGFLIEKKDMPIGIGTSSATIGHAISLGEADVVTIFAENATLADGAATAIANIVKGPDIEKSIKSGLDHIEDIEGIRGAFICRQNKVGQIGKIPKMIKIENKERIIKKNLSEILSKDFDLIK